VNPDIALALGSAPEEARPAIVSLWALDEALGKVLATGREPMISRIRLAWWREALERLDRERAPKEPVLQALGEHVLPRGIAGATLAEMEEGWGAVLNDQPVEPGDLALYARKRGALLFQLSARLLGGDEAAVVQAGEAWALADLARHSTEAHDIETALAAARQRKLPNRWAKPLRPLGMISVLTARDLARGPEGWEEPGLPPRTARMLRHRLTGW
jgi:phytoene synthase